MDIRDIETRFSPALDPESPILEITGSNHTIAVFIYSKIDSLHSNNLM